MKRTIGFLISLCLILLLAAVPVQGERNIGVYYRAPQNTRKIALTFDDGPHPRYTEQILDILEKEGIKATFFAIGCNVKAYPEITKKVLFAGHEIGNHTYTHPLVPLTTEENLLREIEETDALLQSLGCEAPVFFRPPQGKFPADVNGLLDKTGKIAVLWSIDTRDWAHTPIEEIVREVDTKVAGGDIILLHDFVSGESNTIPAIKKLIPMLKKRGYQFVTLSELLLDTE